jgi:hypothetical protein
LGRMCPQKVDLVWNGCPSCVEDLVASEKLFSSKKKRLCMQPYAPKKKSGV